VAFATAGALPLLPYILPAGDDARLRWSAVLTMVSLFGVGAARAAVTRDRWCKTGLEMLLLGGLVAIAAYGAGAFVAWVVR
jgi:vacuolar iron transporter family protein